jgi:protein TonB
MIVDTKGKPQSLEVARSGGEPFDEFAIAAVRSWRFKPATCGGEPISMPIKVEVSFRRRW